NQNGRPLQEPPHGVLWGLYSDGRDYLRVRWRLSSVEHSPPDSLDSGSAFPDRFSFSVGGNPFARNNVVLGVGLDPQHPDCNILKLRTGGDFSNLIRPVARESSPHSRSHV